MRGFGERMQSQTTYLITFTTYGSWLHGDERGSVYRHGTSARKKQLLPDPVLQESMRDLMKWPEVLLDEKARGIVRRAIGEICDDKQWELLALNVRTNHVHAVVASPDTGGRVQQGLKARATRDMRSAGVIGPQQKLWTDRGNRLVLKTPEAIAAAVHYVLHGQGKQLPESPA